MIDFKDRLFRKVPLVKKNKKKDYSKEYTNDKTVYAPVDLTEANVVCSDTAKPDIHRPVIDIDVMAWLVPSSTPGHFHLYFDTEIPSKKYFAMLEAMAEAGVVEPGYYNASKARGYSTLRLPWVKKGSVDDEVDDDEDIPMIGVDI